LHQRIVGFNDLLKRAVPGLQREQSRVILVDQFEGFSVTSDSYDGIHPNKAGAEKIAHKWFAALEGVLGSGFCSGVAGMQAWTY
jgi:lysophospholipase L1-like esterase